MKRKKARKSTKRKRAKTLSRRSLRKVRGGYDLPRGLEEEIRKAVKEGWERS